MAKNLKKLLSFTVALIMVLSLIPAVSAAEETQPQTSILNIPADVEWIMIGKEDTETTDTLVTWWSGKNNSKLMNEYAATGNVAYMKLTEDVIYTPNSLTTIGYVKSGSVPAKSLNLVLDLNGKTLTFDGTYESRVFGIYSSSSLTVFNGNIIFP